MSASFKCLHGEGLEGSLAFAKCPEPLVLPAANRWKSFQLQEHELGSARERGRARKEQLINTPGPQNHLPELFSLCWCKTQRRAGGPVSCRSLNQCDKAIITQRLGK